MNMHNSGVYVQTNDSTANEVVAFARGDDGTLERVGTHATGGRGNGQPHLPSQGSVVLTSDGAHLLVANAGSNDVSVFAIGMDGLKHTDTAATATEPVSIAVHGDLVYVLARGGMGPGSVSGFRLGADGRLAPVAGSSRPLSGDDADGAQLSFAPDGKTLVVTERVTDRISTYAVSADGTLTGPVVHASSGATPYGFDFRRDGALIVTEAFGGEVGAAAASSYVVKGATAVEPVSASVRNTRSEVCWAIVGKDGKFAYVTNFGDGTISSYAVAADGSIELHDPVAASTRLGEKGVRDEALTADGRFLYALDADAREIYGWRVEEDGSLTATGAADGLPETVAGLAAS